MVEDAVELGLDRRAGGRRVAVVHGEAGALRLDGDAGRQARDAVHLREEVVADARRQSANLAALVEAEFGTVHAGGDEAQRRQQRVGFRDRAPGQDGEGAAERGGEPAEGRRQLLRHDYAVRRRCDFEQRAVDIEKQRQARGGCRQRDPRGRRAKADIGGVGAGKLLVRVR